MLVKLFSKFVKTGSKCSSGRNYEGRIVVKSRCSYNYKIKSYFLVDINHTLYDLEFLILKIHIAAFARQSFVSFIYYKSLGVFSQILSSDDHNIGSYFVNSLQDFLNSKLKILNLSFLNSGYIGCFPLGVRIFNLEIKPGTGGVFAKSSGSHCILRDKLKLFNGKEFFGICLPSKKIIYVSFFCKGCLGVVSNRFFMCYNFLSAGSLAYRNRRPHVRGVAMNPVDHPHGGGEGKTSGGRISVTPWGFITKGKKTLKFKKKKFYLLRLSKLKRHSSII